MPVAAPPAHHAHAPTRVGAHAARAASILGLINRARRRYGLRPLRRDRRLAHVATQHSADMAAHHELSHDSSDGTSFARRVHAVTHARVIGETIAEVSGSGAPRVVMSAWMSSPAHRYDILFPGFRRVGIGRARGGGSSIVTADFAS